MKQTELIMGMPITVEVVDSAAEPNNLKLIFDYFRAVDQCFSTYKPNSEISRINRGELNENDYSAEMREVLDLCEQTKQAANGYFDIWHNGRRDPSGVVKGWAIWNAAGQLKQRGFKNYYVEAGGDIQVSGRNSEGQAWQVGIRNPFNRREIIKSLLVEHAGVATSGSYIRGAHIYNPLNPQDKLNEVASLTVIGPDVLEADRFATAAFAMGREGAKFIESMPGLEAYMVDNKGIATLTSGFGRYVARA